MSLSVCLFGRYFQGALDSSAITTAALVYICFNMADTARLDTNRNFAAEQLRKFALCALDFINQHGGVDIPVGASFLDLDASGKCNLEGFLLLANHPRTVVNSLKLSWELMFDSQWLVGRELTSASFLDMIFFVGFCRKVRRSMNKNRWSSNVSAAWESVRTGLCAFVTLCLNRSVRRIIAETPNIVDRAVPSRGRKRIHQPEDQAIVLAEDADRQVRKRFVQLDVGAIFQMYEDALAEGMSLSLLVKSRKREKQAGGSEAAVEYWQRKIQNMYQKRTKLAFQDVQVFNMVSDSSRFSTRDTLVSAFYSPESDLGCYANAQVLKQQSKLLLPGELHLDNQIETLAAQRKIERVASYRFCQAISHQLSSLTGGRVTVDKLLHDPSSAIGIFLQPLSHSELRVTDVDNTGQTKRVRVISKSTGTVVRTLAAESVSDLDFEILTLGLDQGPSQTATASFLLHKRALAHVYWDPYHRLVNDMKLDRQWALGPKFVRQRLQQALLCSSYIFSLSYKPFGGGGFYCDKKEVLEHFVATEYQDCTLA